MISHKYHKFVLSFFMALVMTCIMSLVISIFNLGRITNIVDIWLKAWSLAFVVAFPMIVVIFPIISRFVTLLLREEKPILND